jgi:hypothetical protein
MKVFRLGLISRIALLTVCVEVITIGLLGGYYVDSWLVK